MGKREIGGSILAVVGIFLAWPLPATFPSLSGYGLLFCWAVTLGMAALGVWLLLHKPKGAPAEEVTLIPAPPPLQEPELAPQPPGIDRVKELEIRYLDLERERGLLATAKAHLDARWEKAHELCTKTKDEFELNSVRVGPIDAIGAEYGHLIEQSGGNRTAPERTPTSWQVTKHDTNEYMPDEESRRAFRRAFHAAINGK
jgi:hypothetical protein